MVSELGDGPEAFSASESVPSLFPDTKLSKDHVQNLLHIKSAGEPPEPRKGMAQILGQKLVALSRPSHRIAKRSRNLPEPFPLPLSCDQGSFRTAEGLHRKTHHRGDELFDPGPSRCRDQKPIRRWRGARPSLQKIDLVHDRPASRTRIE